MTAVLSRLRAAARSRLDDLRLRRAPPVRPSPREGAIHIVAMYKCGTSWLTSCFAAHPDTQALREMDLVRALVADDGRLWPAPERVARVFSGSSWCRAPFAEVRALAEEPAERFVARMRASYAAPGAGDAAEREGARAWWQLADADCCALVERLRDATTARQAFDAFVSATAAQGKGRLVLKAADQIGVFDQLLALDPRAAKIAIVRDGRDAAISARHYKELMRETGAPWLRGDADYWRLLAGWRAQARRVRARAARGELYLLRYEDLTLDFDATFAALLGWLGLDASPEVVRAVREATDFEAVTGRKRGEAAKSVRRSGAIREWTSALAPAERERAWQLARAELEAFGYSRDGALGALPPGLGARA